MEEIEKIIELINNGYLINDITEKLHISPKKIIIELRNLEKTNPKLYNEIEKKKKENLQNFRSTYSHERNQSQKNDTDIFKELLQIILKRHMSLEEALIFTKLSKEEFANNLSFMPNDLKNDINALFLRRKKYPQFTISTAKENYKNEIIQLALTYRVSIESMAMLLNTSIDDIQLLFENATDKIGSALEYLKWETSNEPEKNKKFAYEQAQQYLNKRNELCTRIKKARAENQEREILKLTMLLKQLMGNIDDSIVMDARQKKIYLSDLNPLQREKIGRYRLKYALPYRSLSKSGATNVLQISYQNLVSLENEIKEKDPIFANKINDLNNFINNYQLKKIKWSDDLQESKNEMENGTIKK